MEPRSLISFLSGFVILRRAVYARLVPSSLTLLYPYSPRLVHIQDASTSCEPQPQHARTTFPTPNEEMVYERRGRGKDCVGAGYETQGKQAASITV